MKNMPDMFSINIAYLQISPFKAVILYSFWAITQKKKKNRQTFNGETFS